MTGIVFERAENIDADKFLRLRTAYLLEDYGTIPQEQLDKISENLTQYFHKHFNKDMFIYTARSGDETVSCCFLIVAEKPPNPSFINGAVGTVMNVYTKPEYRRKGYAGRLMKMLIADSEKMGLDFVELKATDAGYNLYKSVGFEDTVSKYHNMKISTSSHK